MWKMKKKYTPNEHNSGHVQVLSMLKYAFRFTIHTKIYHLSENVHNQHIKVANEYNHFHYTIYRRSTKDCHVIDFPHSIQCACKSHRPSNVSVYMVLIVHTTCKRQPKSRCKPHQCSFQTTIESIFACAGLCSLNRIL